MIVLKRSLLPPVLTLAVLAIAVLAPAGSRTGTIKSILGKGWARCERVLGRPISKDNGGTEREYKVPGFEEVTVLGSNGGMVNLTVVPANPKADWKAVLRQCGFKTAGVTGKTYDTAWSRRTDIKGVRGLPRGWEVIWQAAFVNEGEETKGEQKLNKQKLEEYKLTFSSPDGP